MTTQKDYTAEEWQTLVRASMAPAVAVSIAANSRPLDQMKEWEDMAFGRNRIAADAFTNNTLVQEIAAIPATEFGALLNEETFTTDDRERTIMLNEAVAACKAAVAILKAKSTADEMQGYCQFVYDFSAHVASVADEGELPLTGEKGVQSSEANALAAIATALELKVS